MSDIVKQDDFISKIKHELNYNKGSNFYDFIQNMCSQKENIKIIDMNKFMLDIFNIYETYINNNEYQYNSTAFLFFHKDIKINSENDILYQSTPFMMEIIGYLMYHNDYVIDKMPKSNYALNNYIISFNYHEKNKFHSKDFYLYGLIARISLNYILNTFDLFKNINLFNLDEYNSIFSKIITHFRKNKFAITYSLMILEYNFENFFYNMFKANLVDINDLFLINNNYKNYYYCDYNKDIDETTAYKTLSNNTFLYEDIKYKKDSMRTSMYMAKLVDNLIVLLCDKNSENNYLSQFKIKENQGNFFYKILLFSSHSITTFLQILKSNDDLNTGIITDLFNLILSKPNNIYSENFDFFYCNTLFDNEENFTEFTNILFKNDFEDKIYFIYACFLISLSKEYPLNKNFQIQLAKTFDRINKNYSIDDFFLLFLKPFDLNNIALKKIITLDNFVYIMDTLNKDFSLLSQNNVNVLKKSKLSKESIDILYKNNVKKSFLKNILNLFKKNDKKFLQNNKLLLENTGNNLSVEKSQISFDNFSFEPKYKEIINNIINNHKKYFN